MILGIIFYIFLPSAVLLVLSAVALIATRGDT